MLCEGRDLAPALHTVGTFFLFDVFLFPVEAASDSDMTPKLKSYEFEGCQFQVTRGDYSPLLQKVVEHLEKAKVVSHGGRRGRGPKEAKAPPRRQLGPLWSCPPLGLRSQQPPGADAEPVCGELHAGLHRGPQEGLQTLDSGQGPHCGEVRGPRVPELPGLHLARLPGSIISFLSPATLASSRVTETPSAPGESLKVAPCHMLGLGC